MWPFTFLASNLRVTATLVAGLGRVVARFTHVVERDVFINIRVTGSLTLQLTVFLFKINA
jgi:hypothetical protein